MIEIGDLIAWTTNASDSEQVGIVISDITLDRNAVRVRWLRPYECNGDIIWEDEVWTYRCRMLSRSRPAKASS